MKNSKNNDLDMRFSLKKYKTKKIISKFNLTKNDCLLFYTDIENINYILKNGIHIASNIKLKSNEHYVVWTFSQLYDQINLEEVEAPHNNFWLWLSNQNINSGNVAVIGINLQILFKLSKKNWKYNPGTNTISVFETISPKTFKWIMLKNKKAKENLDKYINKNDIKIKIFYSSDGSIKL